MANASGHITTDALVNEVIIPAAEQKSSAPIALRKPGSRRKDRRPSTAAATRLASAIKPKNRGVITPHWTTGLADRHGVQAFNPNRNAYTRRMQFTRIDYAALNDRQRENYNFQKVSGVLADYGFSTIRLTADWQGADFVAQHQDGVTFLRVQLKGRPVFDKKYQGKDLFLCFPAPGGIYLYPHDAMLDLVLARRRSVVGTLSWDKHGHYSFPSIPAWLEQILRPHFLPASPAVVPEPVTKL
jgi:hypothetical protein